MTPTKQAIKAASDVGKKYRNKNSIAAGAYLKGPKHKDGGIKVVNKSNRDQPLEVEGGEAVITAPALEDNTLHEFEGKQMTKRQILSAINVDAGGVAFADGGKIRKKMKVKYCNKKYKYGGELKDAKDIVNDCGCKHSGMQKGGQTPKVGQLRKDSKRIISLINSDKGYAILDADHELSGSTWSAGGCYAFARAMQKIYGGKLKTIVSDEGIPQHVLLQVGTIYFDSDGIQTLKKKLQNQEDENVSGPAITDFDKDNIGSIGVGSEETVNKIISLVKGKKREFNKGGAIQQPNALAVLCSSDIGPTGYLPANTLAEAVDACKSYIAEWNLGGSNWTGGNVYDINGKIVAHISYNGRVWEKETQPGKKVKEIIGAELTKRWYERGGEITKGYDATNDALREFEYNKGRAAFYGDDKWVNKIPKKVTADQLSFVPKEGIISDRVHCPLIYGFGYALKKDQRKLMVRGLLDGQLMLLETLRDNKYVLLHSADAQERIMKMESGGETFSVEAFNAFRSGPGFQQAIILLNEKDIDYHTWNDVQIYQWYLKHKDEQDEGEEMESGGYVNKRKTLRIPNLDDGNANNSSYYQHYKHGGITMAKGGKVNSSNSYHVPYPVFTDKPTVINEQGGKVETFVPPPISKKHIREISLSISDRKEVPQIKFTNSYSIYKYLYGIWDKNTINVQESGYILYLNQANQLIGYHELFKGGITGAVIDTEMIVATASKALAKSVVIAHNHPSGNLVPSMADTNLTEEVRRALALVKIRLLDYIIVVPQEGQYYSYMDEGKINYNSGGILAKGGKLTTEQFLATLQKLRKFVPAFQVEALMQIYRGEEREYAIEIINRLLHTFETMPKTYDTEKQETDDKIIYLHYFYGSMDWYIVERDVEAVQSQAFGYADFGGQEGGEWGYISIVELMQSNKIELDFHWTPKTFGELKGKETIAQEKKDTGTTNKPEHKYKVGDKVRLKPQYLKKEPIMQMFNQATVKELSNAYDDEKGYLVDTVLSQDLSPRWFYESEIELIENTAQQQTDKSRISEMSAANPDRIMIVKPTSDAAATKQQASTTTSQQIDINNQIRNLIKQKGTDHTQYSAADIALLKLYEGAGSEKKISSDVRILDQFFTPMDIVAKMWGLAFRHGFKFPGSSVLEPSVGSGRFLSFIGAYDVYVRAYDVDETCATICKVLYPKYDIRHGSFEQEFFKGRRHIGLAGVDKQFDLVIGNPPYREYVSEYAPLGERDATGASTFEMYFIARGVDVLKSGGLLIFIIPNTFLSNDNKYNDFKEKLARKCDLIDAYRLPNGIFGNTDVGTDIIVLRKK